MSLALIGIPEPAAAPLDPAADLRAALERHHADCLGWAMACCGFDRSEAGDVLQDAYLKVLDGRAEFRGESTFRTWLFGVIRRTASEHRRSIVRRIVALGRRQVLETPDEQVDQDASMDRRNSTRRLRELVARLPARQREILHLVFHEDLTVEAAAGIMGCSVGSARTHYARGKARLRALLDGRDP